MQRSVIRSIGRDLAERGYVVLIPHYFERTGHEPGKPYKDKEITFLFESLKDARNNPTHLGRLHAYGL